MKNGKNGTMILMVSDGKTSAKSMAPVEIMLHILPVSGDGSTGVRGSS